MKVTEYMSLEKAAETWHSKPWYIQKACETGQIPDAAKVDGAWIIPADMERPHMHIQQEKQTPSSVQHGTAYKDQIYRMTIEGFPDFNVIEKTIGKTTYYVYGSFAPAARQTVTEKIVHSTLRKMGGEIPSDVQKVSQEICENARKAIPTGDQLRQYYLDKFIEIGFDQEEMMFLMGKIDEHIQTRKECLGL